MADVLERAVVDGESGGVAGERLSARATALGLHTLQDLKMGVLRQRPAWWLGSDYHCALCDLDFSSAQRAAEHVVLEQHPVLRMD